MDTHSFIISNIPILNRDITGSIGSGIVQCCGWFNIVTNIIFGGINVQILRS